MISFNIILASLRRGRPKTLGKTKIEQDPLINILIFNNDTVRGPLLPAAAYLPNLVLNLVHERECRRALKCLNLLNLVLG